MWNVKWCENVKKKCAKQSSRTKEKEASGKQSHWEQLWKPTSHQSQWHISNAKCQSSRIYRLPMEFCIQLSLLCGSVLRKFHPPPVSGKGTTYGAPLLGSSNRWTPQLMRLSPKDAPTLVVYHQFCHLDVFRCLISCSIIITNQTSQIFHHQGTLTSFGGMFWLSLKQRTLVSPVIHLHGLVAKVINSHWWSMFTWTEKPWHASILEEHPQQSQAVQVDEQAWG